MKNFLKDVFDAVFSFGGLMCMFFSAIIFLLITIGAKDSVISAKCTRDGMVQISYDGNRYCVAPANLNLVTAE